MDSGSGLVHTVTVTAAIVHNITEAHKLLCEDDNVAYGDSGYIEIEKRDEIKKTSISAVKTDSYILVICSIAYSGRFTSQSSFL